MDHISLGRLHWLACSPPTQAWWDQFCTTAEVRLKCEVQNRSKVECVQGQRGHRWAGAQAHLCAEIIWLHVWGWIYTDLPPPALFLKKEKERQLASWRPEAVSQVLPGNQRNPGHDGQKQWRDGGGVGFGRQTAESCSAKNTTFHCCKESLPWCKLYLVDTIVFIGQNIFNIHINTWLNSNIAYAEGLVILQISSATYNSYISHVHHVCAAEDWWLN